MKKIKIKIDCGGFFVGLGIGIMLGMIAAAVNGIEYADAYEAVNGD